MSLGLLCTLTSPLGLSAYCSGEVPTLVPGGRVTGGCLTDPYPEMSCKSGVMADKEYKDGTYTIVFNGSYGVKTYSFHLLAGVIE